MQNTTYPTNQDTMITTQDQFSFNQGHNSYCKTCENAMTSEECIKQAKRI